MAVILPFSLRVQPNASNLIRCVSLSLNFMEQNPHISSNEGILLGNSHQDGVKRILPDGNKMPMNVHISDLKYGALIPAKQ